MHTPNLTQSSITAPATIAGNGIALLKVSNDELLEIIARNEKSIEQGKLDYPSLDQLKLVSKLNSLGKTLDYWRFKALADTRFDFTSPAKRQKHDIVYCDDDNEFHFLDSKPATVKALAQYRASKQPRPANKSSFHPDQIVIDETRPATLPRIGTIVFEKPTAPAIVEPSIQAVSSVKLITTQQHQTTPLNDCIKAINNPVITQEKYLEQLEQVIATLPHGNTLKDLVPEYVTAKDEQQAYAKAHAPLNHRICTCCDGAGHIHIKGNPKTGKIKVTGLYRCENAFEPHCYHYDSQYQLQRAIDLQLAWLATGGDWYLVTLDCPHTWRDRLDALTDKLQSVFQDFMQEIKRLLPDIDLSHYLKRLEYAISRLNGHHPHIHLALGLPPLPQDEIERIKAIMRDTWIKYLLKHGLVTNRTKATATKYAFDMRKHDRACEYVAKRHKVAHIKAEIPELMKKWLAGYGITIFEYMSLARFGKVREKQFTRHYAELLKAFDGKQLLKYSNGFERKLGLSELVTRKAPKPPKLPKNKPYEPIFMYQNTFGFDEPPVKEIRYQKRHKGAGRKPKMRIINECQLTLPHIEQLYEQAIATTATPKPYWRPKSHPSTAQWHNLVMFDKDVWKFLTKNHAHRIVLSMIERDYRAGRFDQKPDSYWHDNPRPS